MAIEILDGSFLCFCGNFGSRFIQMSNLRIFELTEVWFKNTRTRPWFNMPFKPPSRTLFLAFNIIQLPFVMPWMIQDILKSVDDPRWHLCWIFGIFAPFSFCSWNVWNCLDLLLSRFCQWIDATRTGPSIHMVVFCWWLTRTLNRNYLPTCDNLGGRQYL